MSVKFEFNEDAMNELTQNIQAKIDEQAGKHPIPRDSSVEQIEAILTTQVTDSGFSADPEAIKVKAQEVFNAFQAGEL